MLLVERQENKRVEIFNESHGKGRRSKFYAGERLDECGGINITQYNEWNHYMSCAIQTLHVAAFLNAKRQFSSECLQICQACLGVLQTEKSITE